MNDGDLAIKVEIIKKKFQDFETDIQRMNGVIGMAEAGLEPLQAMIFKDLWNGVASDIEPIITHYFSELSDSDRLTVAAAMFFAESAKKDGSFDRIVNLLHLSTKSKEE